MEISIVIVNWNSGSDILSCLESVFRTKKELKIEIIVVDNGSRDNSVELIKANYPEVNVICLNKNVGFARACNLGLWKSRGSIVLFLNPDTILTEGTLVGFYEYLKQNKTVGGVGCKITDDKENVLPLMVQKYSSPFYEFIKMFVNETNNCKHIFKRLVPLHDPNRSGKVLKLSGACLGIRRSILNELGGFDERFFMYCEDGELCQRIINKGLELYYLSELSVIHNQGSCSAQAPKGFATLMQCESFEKYMGKYYGNFGKIKYRGYMILGSLGKYIICQGSLFFYSVFYKKNMCDAWLRRKEKNKLVLKWGIFKANATIPD